MVEYAKSCMNNMERVSPFESASRRHSQAAVYSPFSAEAATREGQAWFGGVRALLPFLFTMLTKLSASFSQKVDEYVGALHLSAHSLTAILQCHRPRRYGPRGLLSTALHGIEPRPWSILFACIDRHYLTHIVHCASATTQH
jgi:hypothetical protein